MLDIIEEWPLSASKQRDFWVIQVLNDQQRQMYNEKSNRCNDRIVSIHQPHIRPIVRGKQNKKMELGSMIGQSLADGYVRSDTLSWNAYNESSDLTKQAKAFKQIYGYLSELIQVDKIYTRNANRKWCVENNIRLTAAVKGRKKTPHQKKNSQQETQ